MQINNTLQGVVGAYTQNVSRINKAQRQADSSYAAAAQDEIVLSPEAQRFSAALQRAKASADDVRADKVAYFEERVANGTYGIDAQGIAAKMMSLRF